MSTLGQRLATATEFGYAITGLVAIVAVLTGQRWSRPALWLWTGLLTVTAGLAPVVWGGAGVLPAITAGVATGLIVWGIVWLATRQLAGIL
jgi:hypothetical protein